MIEVNGAYISDDIPSIINELKRQLALNGVDRFYKMVDTPNNTMICCPFHKNGQERKPSMGILKKDGTCHCFACGYTSNLSEMVSNCFGYDDWGTFGSKWLIKNFIAIQLEERKDIELDLDRKPKKAVTQKYVSEEELDKYRYYHPYWTKRKITDERLIELFDLGYDKDSACITMPVRNKNGNCLFVARRSVQTKFFHYPEGVDKPLYGLYELWLQAVTGTKCENGIKQHYYSRMFFPQEVIVCESMIDCLTCWQYGKYAVALNGLGTELQFKQLRELPCRKLIIATDNDDAGMRARHRIAKNVTNKIITQYMFPDGAKDINDLTKQQFDNLSEIFL